MKFKNLIYYFIFVSSFILSSCNNTETKLRELWEIDETIDYVNFSEIDQRKFERVLSNFSRIAESNKNNWDCGFSQQCSLFRKLYFYDKINTVEFLENCIKIYESYPYITNEISIHSLGYGIALKYIGNDIYANKIFQMLLEDEVDKKVITSDDSILIKIVSSKLLYSKLDFVIDDKYQQFFLMSEKELIDNFVGL